MVKKDEEKDEITFEIVYFDSHHSIWKPKLTEN